jgi:hypothetical protein
LQVGILQVGNFAGWNFAGWGFCRLEFCRLPGILQVDNANLILLQSDSLSALLISAYPATMFLASALRSGHHPCENIQNDQIGLDLQGDECFDCCEEPT